MNTAILKIQLWELWRLTCVELSVRFLLPMAFLAFLSMMMGPVRYYTANLTFEVILLASLTSMLWINSIRTTAYDAFPFLHRFSYPATTGQLVLVPFLWVLLTNSFLYLVLVFAAHILFDVSFPTFRMIPVVLFATCVIISVAWGVCGPGRRVVFLGAANGLMLAWLSPHIQKLDLTSITSALEDDALRLSGTEHVLLLTAAAALGGLCLYRVRQRRSIGIVNKRVASDILPRPDSSPASRVRAFRSPHAAQIWFERRRVARRSFFIVVGGFAIAVVSTLWSDSSSVLRIFWTTFMLTPLVLLVCAADAVLGLRQDGQSSRLSIFEATLPIEETDAIRLKTRIVMEVLFAAFLLFGLGLLACVIFLYGLDDVGKVLASVVQSDFRTGVTLIVVAVSLVVALSGASVRLVLGLGYAVPRLKERRWIILVFSLMLLGTAVISVLEELSGSNLEFLSRAYMLLGGVALAGLSLMILCRAVRVGFYTKVRVTVLAVGWALLSATALRFAHNAGAELPELTAFSGIFFVGVLCIPVASVAWAPLSLAALRHR